MAAAARKEFLDSGAPGGGTGWDKGDRVNLADSLMGETFMLFLYGVSIAMAGIVIEIVAQWMAPVISTPIAIMVPIIHYVSLPLGRLLNGCKNKIKLFPNFFIDVHRKQSKWL